MQDNSNLKEFHANGPFKYLGIHFTGKGVGNLHLDELTSKLGQISRARIRTKQRLTLAQTYLLSVVTSASVATTVANSASVATSAVATTVANSASVATI